MIVIDHLPKMCSVWCGKSLNLM